MAVTPALLAALTGIVPARASVARGWDNYITAVLVISGVTVELWPDSASNSLLGTAVTAALQQKIPKNNEDNLLYVVNLVYLPILATGMT